MFYCRYVLIFTMQWLAIFKMLLFYRNPTKDLLTITDRRIGFQVTGNINLKKPIEMMMTI